MNKRFTQRSYPKFNETYYECLHSSGLHILVCPKKRSTAYAHLAVKYGSCDISYTSDISDEKILKSPHGTAHFLEHKMFECPGIPDISVEFAKLGGDVNAYTTEEETVYYFSCTENFNELLKLLITFVNTPYFTEESVEKERAIIAEEIKMYKDNPDSKLYYALLRGMYKYHPIRYDVAGEVADIKKINVSTLYDAYNSFYVPGNMYLCVCGNVEPDEIYEICDRILPHDSKIAACSMIHEPESVYKSKVEVHSDVTVPKCIIGIKNSRIESDSYERMKTRAAMKMLALVLFGSWGEFSSSLYEDGIIASPLYHDVIHTAKISNIKISCECRNHDLFFKKYEEYIEQVKVSGINDTRFEQIKRSLYGSFISEIDYTESIADMLVTNSLEGCDMYDYAKCVLEMQKGDLERLLPMLLCKKYTTYASLLGAKGEQK